MCIYSIFCGHIVKFLGEKEENELCEGVRAGCHGGYIRYIHRETHRCGNLSVNHMCNCTVSTAYDRILFYYILLYRNIFLYMHFVS